ncbi:arsenate reductase family protein [Nocardia sp. NPDC057353]|uniref:arsenate reductase family protein n=1 Tax=Nocardia sp. NPDC057353 TaxID=3346104 RepID=UPI003627F965
MSTAPEIWHNPRCSKSRAATIHLDGIGAEYTVRRYLDDPPTPDELRAVLARLGLEPWEITRTGEAVAKELGLKEWLRTDAARERWIAALAAHPVLIERPIVLTPDGGAIVARTQEALARLGSAAGR